MTAGPSFKMMDAAAQKPAPFDVIIVHSFSRFFRDQFRVTRGRPAARRGITGRNG
jgi:hypothetical protein